MARSHDGDIVALRDMHLFFNMIVVTKDHLLGCGVVFGLRKVFAVIKHRHAEPDVCQHRHQRFSYVTAAENINPACTADGFDVIRRLSLAVDRAACEPRAEHRFVQLGKAQPVRLVERSHRGNFPVLHPADEPRVLPACQKLENGFHQFQVARACVIEKAEVDRDVAAADHADIVHLIGS